MEYVKEIQKIKLVYYWDYNIVLVIHTSLTSYEGSFETHAVSLALILV